MVVEFEAADDDAEGDGREERNDDVRARDPDPEQPDQQENGEFVHQR